MVYNIISTMVSSDITVIKRRYKRVKGKLRRQKAIVLSSRANTAVLPQAGLQLINKNVRIHRFSRSLLDNVITQPVSTGSASGVASINLSQLPNYTEFTALYSLYRIKKLKFTFRVPMMPTSSELNPTIYAWKNQEPYATTFTGPSLNQRSNIRKYQTSPDNRMFEFSIYPYTIDTTVASTSSQNEMKYNRWFSTDAYSIPYFGLAYFIDNLLGTVTGVPITIQYDMEVHVEFKSVE